MSTDYKFADETNVYALIPHGGIFRRMIRAGHPGTVFHTLPDGRVTVEWANGKTTTVPPAWITTDTREIRADVDPHFEALIENALSAVDPNPDAPNAHGNDWEAGWEAGWGSALDAVREALCMEGLISDLTKQLPEEK